MLSADKHGIDLSYSWIKRALQTAGLVAQTRKRGKHRKKRLRRRKITTLEEANRFLRDSWIPYHREHFTVPPPQAGTAFVPYAGAELEKIFSRQEDRLVGNDNTISFGKLTLQIEPQPFRFSLAGCRVLICQHLDDTLSLYYGPHLLGQDPLIPVDKQQICSYFL